MTVDSLLLLLFCNGTFLRLILHGVAKDVCYEWKPPFLDVQTGDRGDDPTLQIAIAESLEVIEVCSTFHNAPFPCCQVCYPRCHLMQGASGA
jgi:hypothetical protein